MADKYDDQPVRISPEDLSPESLQKDPTSRVVRPVVYGGTALGALLGIYADPAHWVQGVVLYGFLGLTVGILIGSVVAWLKRIKPQPPQP